MNPPSGPSSAFKDCINSMKFKSLSGCTADCSPTYNMLIRSEIPTTAEFINFGAGSGISTKPATSLCTIK